MWVCLGAEKIQRSVAGELCRSSKMSDVEQIGKSGRPRKPKLRKRGQAVYHRHSGTETLVRSLNYVETYSKGTKHISMALWCPVCGFTLTERGRRMQIDELKRLYGL